MILARDMVYKHLPDALLVLISTEIQFILEAKVWISEVFLILIVGVTFELK